MFGLVGDKNEEQSENGDVDRLSGLYISYILIPKFFLLFCFHFDFWFKAWAMNCRHLVYFDISQTKMILMHFFIKDRWIVSV